MSCFGWEGKDLEQIIKIAAMVAGGRDELRNNPFIACYAEPISPLHHAGYIESGNTGSLFQLVMCDEIIGMVRRFVRGIKVDEEHLALEVIKDTGPAGNFLDQEHTRKYFKEEFWFPGLLNRMRYVNWQEKAGGADLEEKIKERTGEILEEHKVEPKPEEVQESIEEIIAKAEERVAQQKNK